jgi:hypothetical protein
MDVQRKWKGFFGWNDLKLWVLWGKKTHWLNFLVTIVVPEIWADRRYIVCKIFFIKKISHPPFQPFKKKKTKPTLGVRACAWRPTHIGYSFQRLMCVQALFWALFFVFFFQIFYLVFRLNIIFLKKILNPVKSMIYITSLTS